MTHKENAKLALVFWILVCTTFSGCSWIRQILNHDGIDDKTANPIQVDLINDILPVRRIDSESASMLDNLSSNSAPQQRTILKNVLQRITQDVALGEDIGLNTMKDRVLNYLGVPHSEVDRIYFYLVSGDNIEAAGGDGKFYTGYIKDGCIVTLVTKSGSSTYILKCSNGLSTKTDQEFADKRLIGELESKRIERTVYFKKGKSDIKSLGEEEKQKIKECARLISEDRNAIAEVVGHTDSEGTPEQNRILSEKRALSVRDHLSVLGVPIEQIGNYRGAGETELAQRDDRDGVLIEEIAWKNRRAEIIVNSWDIIEPNTWEYLEYEIPGGQIGGQVVTSQSNDGINIRQGPSIEEPVIGYAQSGSWLRIKNSGEAEWGKDQETLWIKVHSKDDKIGYVHYRLVNLVARGNPVIPGSRLGVYRHGLYPSWGQRTHAGVDIVANCETNIYAFADGMVIDAVSKETDGNFNSLGYMVIIEHPASLIGKPFYTIYLHMKNPPTKGIGEEVKGGKTLIGVVGMTGAANNSCHTHFEIRYFAKRFSQWNNIYGDGDKRGTEYFKQNWEDPVEFFYRYPNGMADQQAP